VSKADKIAIKSGRTTRSTRVAALRLRTHLIANSILPRDRHGWREYKHWAEAFLAYYDQARSKGDGLGLTPTEVADIVNFDGRADLKGRREQHVLAVMAVHTIRKQRGAK
jgi:hypothetical protein